jgi:predicted secreted Zn-dependent protease
MAKILLTGFVSVAICGLLFTSAAAQPFRHLTAFDFRGAANSLGEGVAYTNCSIEYRYIARKERGYYVLDFTVRLKMNSDMSWIDRRIIRTPELLAEILKHEQGHYNIAYMEQQELLRTISKTVFYADYQRVAQNIFSRIDAKYQQLNQDYDNDTAHSVNRQQQHSWDVFFQRNLGTEYLARN